MADAMTTGEAGRTVYITGAGSGIGLATASRFAAAGDRLALFHLGQEREIEELAAAHPGGADLVHGESLDVRDREAVERVMGEACAAVGVPDVVVTAAGRHSYGPSPEASWQDWDEVLAVNLSGTFAVIRALAAAMLERGSGRIVTISSELGISGMAENAAYCASKGGVINLTRALAREFSPRGVTVNSVAPGPVLTEMLVGAPEYGDGSALRGILLGRYGRPEEIAAMIEALAGEAGAFTTGQVISPNGGAVI